MTPTTRKNNPKPRRSFVDHRFLTVGGVLPPKPVFGVVAVICPLPILGDWIRILATATFSQAGLFPSPLLIRLPLTRFRGVSGQWPPDSYCGKFWGKRRVGAFALVGVDRGWASELILSRRLNQPAETLPP